MATTKSYVPGQYPVLPQANGTRKFVSNQLQQISLAVNALNAQAGTGPAPCA